MISTVCDDQGLPARVRRPCSLSQLAMALVPRRSRVYRSKIDLAAAGVMEPLPDLTGSTWHAPQHDRLTPRYPEAETLERALAEFGLSPHPRVILLLEGKTEQRHVPRLLAEVGLTQPHQVRVQPCRSSKVNAHLIARYGITPRIGRRVGDRWLLDASPTALVLAMDPREPLRHGGATR